MMRRQLLVILLLILAGAACAGRSNWDPLAEVPVRPELPDGYDPNDPYHLYNYGESQLATAPMRAAGAFYWASRLDPLWADPIYARRIALFMASPRIFADYIFDRRRVDHVPGVQRLDSLYHRALSLNPFLVRRHDVLAIKRTMEWQIEEAIRRQNPTATIDRNAITYALHHELQRAPDAVRAWIAESEGRLGDALELYTRAVERDEDDPELRTGLARIQFRMGRFDEARESFGAALELLREKDEEELVRLYESKVLLEHSIGLILEQQGDVEGARNAYGRALQEDLSYAPSHVRLAELALAGGDTAAALGEFALAVEAAPGSGGLRYQHGSLLARAGQLEAAERELRRAIELEPHFAAPYRVLGAVLERMGRRAEAVQQYREYLDRSSRSSPDRSRVEQRLTALAAGGGESEGPR
ncbi:MAG TPA: tetratricopeptide repeat protein [Longimicrobiales bacterium]